MAKLSFLLFLSIVIECVLVPTVVTGSKDAVVTEQKDAAKTEQKDAVETVPNDAVVTGSKDPVETGRKDAGEEDDRSTYEKKCLSSRSGYESSFRSGGYYFSSAREPVSKQPCPSQDSNPRGMYTSTSPCTFRFHKVTQTESLHVAVLSTACSGDNLVEPGAPDPQDYLQGWTDECVADYVRCYSVDRDEKIYLENMCNLKWPIPDGTTHISVNCTSSKMTEEMIKKVDTMSNEFDFLKHQQEADEKRYAFQSHRLHEMYAIFFVSLTVCLLSLTGCMCCVYKFVFKPYMAELKKTRSNSELKDLV